MRTGMLNAHDLIECARCGKTEFLGMAEGWNVIFDKGTITGHLCPDCQTDEESIEAEVNAVFTDYSTLRTVGSLEELLDMLRPQFEESMRTIADGDVEKGNELFREYLEQFKDIANAMQRNNPDFYLANTDEAFLFLQELGEIPEQ